MLALLAEGREDLSGIVFDPCLEGRQAELLTEAREHHIEAVLDPRTIELATPGGVAQGRVTELPWAGQQLPHTTELLSGVAGEQLVEALADYVIRHKFSAVLAPTHYVRSATDSWLEVDTALCGACATSSTLRDWARCRSTIRLRCPQRCCATRASAPRSPPPSARCRSTRCGCACTRSASASGPLALRRYIEGCRALHALGLPLVAGRTGTVGVALLAFGAVGYRKRDHLRGALRRQRPAAAADQRDPVRAGAARVYSPAGDVRDARAGRRAVRASPDEEDVRLP